MILPAVFRNNSPKLLSEMLRRYIQQTTLHHQEFNFSQIRVRYGLNETYTELSKKIQLPEVYYNKNIFSTIELKKLLLNYNNTKSKIALEGNKKYSLIVQQILEEKTKLVASKNRY